MVDSDSQYRLGNFFFLVEKITVLVFLLITVTIEIRYFLRLRDLLG